MYRKIRLDQTEFPVVLNTRVNNMHYYSVCVCDRYQSGIQQNRMFTNTYLTGKYIFSNIRPTLDEEFVSVFTFTVWLYVATAICFRMIVCLHTKTMFCLYLMHMNTRYTSIFVGFLILLILKTVGLFLPRLL
jgi:hypothetical protein